MTICRMIVMLVAVGALAPAWAQPSRDRGRGDRSDGREAMRERYELLLERNLFLKDRRPAPPQSERTARPPDAPPPVESLYVVIGLVEEDGGQVRAHVEDRRTGELLLLNPGDAIAQGVIESVDLDGVVYKAGEEQTRIAVGQDLRGQTGAPPATPSAQPSSSSGDSAGSGNGSPSEAEMSIIERMRQRRMQQGGRQ